MAEIKDSHTTCWKCRCKLSLLAIHDHECTIDWHTRNKFRSCLSKSSGHNEDNVQSKTYLNVLFDTSKYRGSTVLEVINILLLMSAGTPRLTSPYGNVFCSTGPCLQKRPLRRRFDIYFHFAVSRDKLSSKQWTEFRYHGNLWRHHYSI